MFWPLPFWKYDKKQFDNNVNAHGPKAFINRLNIVSWSAENLLSHARANVKKILRRMVKSKWSIHRYLKT